MCRHFAICVFAILLCNTRLWSGDADTDSKAARLLDQRVAIARIFDIDHENLADDLAFLSDVTGIKLHADWNAIQAAGVSRDAPVSQLRAFVLGKRTLRETLQTILLQAGGGKPKLDFYIKDGVVEVTTREAADAIVYTIVYTLDGIEHLRLPNLGPVVTASLLGFAKIRFYNGQAIVTAPRFVHECIAGPVD